MFLASLCFKKKKKNKDIHITSAEKCKIDAICIQWPMFSILTKKLDGIFLRAYTKYNKKIKGWPNMEDSGSSPKCNDTDIIQQKYNRSTQNNTVGYLVTEIV